MFEFITCSYQSINDWGVLLVRLIVRGVIDLTNNADLYCTALDMITALIHSTLVIDREVGQNIYFCTHSPVRNAFDVGSIHYEGEGLGPENLDFFWPCEMASSR
jgi:hypothetical protein